jgi:hypothetical protein
MFFYKITASAFFLISCFNFRALISPFWFHRLVLLLLLCCCWCFDGGMHVFCLRDVDVDVDVLRWSARNAFGSVFFAGISLRSRATLLLMSVWNTILYVGQPVPGMCCCAGGGLGWFGTGLLFFLFLPEMFGRREGRREGEEQ